MAACDRPPPTEVDPEPECLPVGAVVGPLADAGAAVWADPVRLSDPPQGGQNPVFYDVQIRNGAMHIAFGTGSPDGADIFHAVHVREGWAQSTNISRSPHPALGAILQLDAHGTPFVLWYEQRAQHLIRDRLISTTLLFASGGASGWSAGEVLWHAPDPPETQQFAITPMLQPPLRGAVLVDARGEVHVAFAMVQPPEARPQLAHTRRSTAGSWSEPGNIGLGFSPKLTVDAEGRLFLASIGGEELRDVVDITHRNPVSLRYSEDGGCTWSPIEWISIEENAAHYPQVIAAADGSLHLLWQQDITGNIFPDEVWHVRSDDGGETWSDPVSIAPSLPGHLYPAEPVPDATGGLHLVVGQRDHPINFTFRRPHYIYYDGSTWSEPEHLFGIELGVGLIRADHATGELHLMLRETERDADGEWQTTFLHARPR